MAIARESIEKLRSKVTVSQVSEKLLGTPPDATMISCPFHSDTAPSCSLKGTYFYCFGCKEGGDVFEFASRILGEDFNETVQFIADMVGEDIQYSSGTSKRKTVLNEVLDYWQKAQKAFSDLDSEHPARLEITKRGLPAETEAGFVPENGFGVSKESGLTTSKGYELLKGRLIFPIRNLSGKVVSFTGRKLEGIDSLEGKWVNGQNSTVYNKGETVAGLDSAKETIRQKGAVLICEGFADLLALRAAGIQNSVCTLGTSLTPKHLELIRNTNKSLRVFLGFDFDEAGLKATMKVLKDPWLKAYSYVIPVSCEQKDWGDIYLTGGRHEVMRLLSLAKPAIEAVIYRLFSSATTPQETDQAYSQAKDFLAISGASPAWLSWLDDFVKGTETSTPRERVANTTYLPQSEEEISENGALASILLKHGIIIKNPIEVTDKDPQSVILKEILEGKTPSNNRLAALLSTLTLQVELLPGFNPNTFVSVLEKN